MGFRHQRCKEMFLYHVQLTFKIYATIKRQSICTQLFIIVIIKQLVDSAE